MVRLLLAAALTLTACSSDELFRVPSTPTLPSHTTAEALYASPETFDVSEPEPHTVVYTDAVGIERSVPVVVRTPVAAEGLRPVVVWSHGGSTGKTNALRSGPAWGEALAAAGYVVVSVAHPGRPHHEMEPLCRHVGYASRDACQGGFRSVKWDRQLDLIAVLDWVEALAEDPAWAVRIDATRIALAGHSAGSGGAAELAGAVRFHGPSDTESREDLRPVAFLLLALQGPDEQKGFAPDAWAGITRPVFGATGLGDVTDSTAPENRIRVFDSLDSEGSRLLWIEEEGAAHTLFNLETAACERRGRTRAQCEAMANIVRSAAVAFLDAHVAGREEARHWLDEVDLRSETEGRAWWLVR